MFPTSFTLDATIPISSDPTHAADQILRGLFDFLRSYRVREFYRADTYVEYQSSITRLLFRETLIPWMALCTIQVLPADNAVRLIYDARFNKILLWTTIAISVFVIAVLIWIPSPLIERLVLILVILLFSWVWIYGLGYYLQSYIWAHFFMRRLKNWAAGLIAE